MQYASEMNAPSMLQRSARRGPIDREGAVSVEYALVAALVVLLGFGVIYSGTLGTNLRITFQTLANSV